MALPPFHLLLQGHVVELCEMVMFVCGALLLWGHSDSFIVSSQVHSGTSI